MNKVKYGLRNVYFAKYTIGENNAYTYSTPKRLPGGVSLSISANGDRAEFYADDILYFNADNNQGYTGTLTIADITDDFKKDILGQVQDANGALIENSDASTSPFALLFEVQGDKKPRRFVYYDCSVARPGSEFNTKESSVSPATDALEITMKPRLSDNAVKAVLEKSDTNETVYNNFFSSVYEKTLSL